MVGVLRSIVKAEKLLDTSQASSQVTLLGTLLIKEDGTVVPVSKEFEGYEGSTLYQVLEEGACLPIRSPMYVPASRTSEMWQRSCWASRTAT